jgi:hypothetical protein
MDDYSASSQIDLSVHRFIAIHAFPFFGFRPALANTRLTLFFKKGFRINEIPPLRPTEKHCQAAVGMTG